MPKIENKYSVNGGGIEGYDTDTKEIYWEIFGMDGSGGWKERYHVSRLQEISLPFYRANIKGVSGWTFSMSIHRNMRPKDVKYFAQPSDNFIFHRMEKEKCLEMFAAIAKDYIIANSLSEFMDIAKAIAKDCITANSLSESMDIIN